MNESPKRVLVVDDAATVRMYHRAILEGEGLRVDEALNGIEAMEKTLAEPYDLYLVDVNMPKQDGYGFLRDLRRQELRQAPAVVISTEARDRDRMAAYQAGASYYLVKPVRSEELLLVCRVLLGSAGGRE